MAEATITAIGVLAAARAQGALLHFYLDDGQAMQARDYGAYVGWAALELHLAEALCGARLAHSWGGLVHVPRHRALVHLALDDLRRLTGSASLGSMIFGNTVDMRPRADLHNHSVIATSALVDIACQLRRPTGHAIHVTPLTEAELIPSAAENAEVLLARGLEREARRSGDLFDWAALERDARALAEHGLRFKERALVLLADDGVDVQDPAALFLALRQTGLAELEQRCDLVVPAAIRALEPWKAGHVRAVEERLGATLPRLDGVRALLRVVDVHDVVRDALLRALPAAGCEVVLLPSDASPEAIAHAAVAEDVDGIVLGTANGAALTLGRRLCFALDSEGWEGPVVIGGRLNEDDGGPLPVDVTDDLRALGLEPAHAVEDVGRALAASRAWAADAALRRRHRLRGRAPRGRAAARRDDPRPARGRPPARPRRRLRHLGPARRAARLARRRLVLRLHERRDPAPARPRRAVLRAPLRAARPREPGRPRRGRLPADGARVRVRLPPRARPAGPSRAVRPGRSRMRSRASTRRSRSSPGTSRTGRGRTSSR